MIESGVGPAPVKKWSKKRLYPMVYGTGSDIDVVLLGPEERGQRRGG